MPPSALISALQRQEFLCEFRCEFRNLRRVRCEFLSTIFPHRPATQLIRHEFALFLVVWDAQHSLPIPEIHASMFSFLSFFLVYGTRHTEKNTGMCTPFIFRGGCTGGSTPHTGTGIPVLYTIKK